MMTGLNFRWIQSLVEQMKVAAISSAIVLLGELGALSKVATSASLEGCATWKNIALRLKCDPFCRMMPSAFHDWRVSFTYNLLSTQEKFYSWGLSTEYRVCTPNLRSSFSPTHRYRDEIYETVPVRVIPRGGLTWFCQCSILVPYVFLLRKHWLQDHPHYDHCRHLSLPHLRLHPLLQHFGFAIMSITAFAFTFTFILFSRSFWFTTTSSIMSSPTYSFGESEASPTIPACNFYFPSRVYISQLLSMTHICPGKKYDASPW